MAETPCPMPPAGNQKLPGRYQRIMLHVTGAALEVSDFLNYFFRQAAGNRQFRTTDFGGPTNRDGGSSPDTFSFAPESSGARVIAGRVGISVPASPAAWRRFCSSTMALLRRTYPRRRLNDRLRESYEVFFADR